MATDLTTPLNYYAAYAQIKHVLPEDCIIVSEGANTMDTSRSILNHRLPRHRYNCIF
jgi:2-hydroxyacyl-CoA lyase 1